jgi:hypothetical protein
LASLATALPLGKMEPTGRTATQFRSTASEFSALPIMTSDGPYQSPQEDEPPSEIPVTDQNGHVPIRLIVGRMSLSDFYHAHRLAIRFYWLRVLVIYGLAAAYVSIFVAIAISARPFSPEASNRILTTVLLVLPLVVALPLALNRLKVWRLWRQRRGIFAEVQSTIAEDGITMQWKKLGISSHYPWDAFASFRLSNRVAVVYVKTQGIEYVIVSRARFAQEQEWEAFVQLFKEKLVQL